MSLSKLSPIFFIFEFQISQHWHIEQQQAIHTMKDSLSQCHVKHLRYQLMQHSSFCICTMEPDTYNVSCSMVCGRSLWLTCLVSNTQLWLTVTYRWMLTLSLLTSTSLKDWKTKIYLVKLCLLTLSLILSSIYKNWNVSALAVLAWHEPEML